MKNYDAVIFDLDGVITKTALVHAASWKEMFDEHLKLREQRDSEPFKEFTHEKDYLPFVDGKPRYKGVQSFLESRGINISFGDPTDTPDAETVCGLGNKKNVKFKSILEEKGAEVFDLAVALMKNLKANGVHIGVASSSKNCQLILQKTNLEDLFETRVDGVVSAEMGLKGKPEGDIFVTACQNVGCTPDRAVVVEDAVSGVQAGKNGKFGLVLGVAREGNDDDLKNNGADIVVNHFEGVDAQKIDQWFEEIKR